MVDVREAEAEDLRAFQNSSPASELKTTASLHYAKSRNCCEMEGREVVGRKKKDNSAGKGSECQGWGFIL